ncbi:hypothetical protein F7F68_24220 [Escherichia coli]|nr:hypothetical protein [Escherichia coli]QCH94641.1 hypothetical protein CCU01_018665 [Escherichia coli O145:NM]QNS69795.1 hypothetical protein DXE50_08385 [Escherichia coli O145]EFB3115147.1 hypothetical protein [Escherichia coli]EFE7936955.1 hypothetical protein [Escherichia coli]
MLFFKLTNCIKSIQWNNFLHFSSNYGYKFCNVLFFAIFVRIKNCSFVLYRSINLSCCCSSDHYSIMIKIKSILAGLLLSILVPVDAGKYRKGGSVPSQNMVGGIVRRLVIVGMT